MLRYIALMRKDPDSDYGVDFPDFPGCITAGSTMEEARGWAAEALTLHVDGMLQDKERLPNSSSLDEIRADPDNSGEDVVLAFEVAIPDPRRSARIQVTIPEPILQEVDIYAPQHGFSRSSFLAYAAANEMKVSGRAAHKKKKKAATSKKTA